VSNVFKAARWKYLLVRGVRLPNQKRTKVIEQKQYEEIVPVFEVSQGKKNSIQAEQKPYRRLGTNVEEIQYP